MTVYSVELVMRFYCYGIACLRSGWVLFDFVLVAAGVFANYILTPILEALSSDGEDESRSGVGFVMVLRVMRLMRLARAVLLVVQFRILWRLVSGLLASAMTILYTFTLIFLFLYIYSCMALELITKSTWRDELECTNKGMDPGICYQF